jgi:hypothetical protein
MIQLVAAKARCVGCAGTVRLLRERGVRDTCVADAMSQTDMTHGGFCRHFQTKDDLVIVSGQ